MQLLGEQCTIYESYERRYEYQLQIFLFHIIFLTIIYFSHYTSVNSIVIWGDFNSCSRSATLITSLIVMIEFITD